MTYQEIVSRILQLQEEGLEIFNAGKSTLGKNILATHVGSFDGPQVLIQAGIHAREWITSLLTIELARSTYLTGEIIEGGIYFIFMANPDGIQISLDGLDAVPCEISKNYLIAGNNGSADFSQMKSNFDLVDLNTNFDANWGGGAQNVTCPSTQNFIGFYPESEREVRSLEAFTLQTKPLITISYHSKGNIIYYGFDGESDQDVDRDLSIGEALSETTGYPLVFTENSTGGYKDWCIQKLKIPAYTIEVGSDTIPHPLSEETLPEIYARNKDVPSIALEKAIEYANSIDFGGQMVQNVKYENNKLHATSNQTSNQSKHTWRSAYWRSHRQGQ